MKEILTAALIVVFVGCGVSPSPQYRGKVFSDGIDPTEPPVREGQSRTSDADATVAEDSEDVTSDDTVAEGGSIDPDTIIFHAHYRSAFATETSMRLVDGEPASADLGLAESQIMDGFENSLDTDGLEVSQTYGDGKSLSEGQQIVLNNAGDVRALEEGEDSSSGTQTYVRTTEDPTCPNIFVCIEEMTFTPDTGEPSTYCFYDATGATRVALPYAIPPSVGKDAITDHLGEHGPYTVARYAGQVQCEAPGSDPFLVEQVILDVSFGESEQVDRYFQDADQTPYDYELVTSFRRVADDNVAPYIDETVRLQKQTRSFISSSDKRIVKMIKTNRSSVELSAFQSLFVTMDGLQVDLHFELCADLMKDDATFCD